MCDTTSAVGVEAVGSDLGRSTAPPGAAIYEFDAYDMTET